ncbi:MAG: phytoene/squalene synthase family protein [Flavobacteriaceae bacterium]|jgi:phytoene/squalene synthetase|nr:phytoene/squalene synthase family protein [Flavobacteriaceae bacterium]MBT3919739.1 phytoene/squalene synthase family protein [Flavobacteriaceae bacterium]MBT6704867.1 phytoene/squalene synthase family protein [Flavobacteriaceae bacterium]MBT7242890.1 phytoene/squalene synthase family protein [Flavobacteriaceae bacterium]
MKELFDSISNESATLITKKYSTSFSIAVRLLAPDIRQAIYNIYGFVRVADEIVDSFEGYPKEELLNRFEGEYQYAIETGISTNPVINAFQKTVKEYNIEAKLVESFLKSMRADLNKQVYENQEEIDEYIYGSADVVGLMCLKVFVNGDTKEYDRLKDAAISLGSAFQKVNFLRDLKQDYAHLNRTYFPNINPENLTTEDKNKIVQEIKEDFNAAYIGIKELPKEARFGVYVAYKYYLQLLKKVDKTPAEVLMDKRIRVSNLLKTYLLFQSYISYKIKIT